jgi:hypothetical protein
MNLRRNKEKLWNFLNLKYQNFLRVQNLTVLINFKIYLQNFKIFPQKNPQKIQQ